MEYAWSLRDKFTIDNCKNFPTVFFYYKFEYGNYCVKKLVDASYWENRTDHAFCDLNEYGQYLRDLIY